MKHNNIILPRMIAHRGASAHAPENTIAAFRLAKKLGATMVEWDLRLTRDQQWVIIHDEDLQRVANVSAKVSELSLSEIQQLPLAIEIPTFEAGLQCVIEEKLAVNIEIKPLPSSCFSALKQLLATLSRYQPRCFLSSFDLALLTYLRLLAPAMPLGALFSELPTDWSKMIVSFNPFCIGLNQALVTAAQISEIKAAGYQVTCYTVDDPGRAEWLFLAGVDAIFTNRVNLNLDYQAAEPASVALESEKRKIR